MTHKTTTKILISFVVSLMLSFMLTTSIYAQTPDDRSLRMRIFHLLNFVAIESSQGGQQNPPPGQPPSQPPGQPPQSNTKTTIINAENASGKISGQGEYDPNRQNPAERFILTIEFIAKNPPDPDVYVAWLKRADTWIRMGIMTGGLQQDNTYRYYIRFTSSEDLTSAEIIITKEPTDQPGQPTPTQPSNPDPATHIIRATQQPQATPTPAGATPTPVVNTPTPGGPTPPPGATNTPTPPQQQNYTQQIQDMLNQVSEQNIREYLKSITDDDDIPGDDEEQTRWSVSEGYRVESQYARSFFESNRLTVDFQDFTIDNARAKGPSRNVIAQLPGTGPKAQEYYLIVGHLDSTSSNTPGSNNDPAPGADDNGTGSVVVMETARVLKNSGLPFNYSLEFILFGGEEQVLIGSQHYVSRMGNKKIKGVINIDMLGFNSNPQNDCVKFGYKARNGSNILTDTLSQVKNQFTIPIQFIPYETTIEASDHAPFWNNNIPAVFGFECELVTGGQVTPHQYYHSVEDKMSHVDFSQVTNTAKLVAGTLATLALEQ